MKELRKIKREDLNVILEKHKRWLATYGKEGERADLSYTDLRGFTLARVNLAGADLRFANLSHADLLFTRLSDACLTGANLVGANLYHANLTYADLYSAYLFRADLAGADLAGADLRAADLSNANFTKANLTDVKNFPDIPMECPESGSFIGWKCACGYIVKLEIPADAKRSSGTGIECRCNKATVLAIENIDGTPAGVSEVCSDYDENFIYRVGETVTVDDFDDNRFNECAPGIHFYIDRKYAFHIFIRH